MMSLFIFRIFIVITAVVIVCSYPYLSQANHKAYSDGIPARLAADYVHSIIEAGRTTYSRKIVDRLYQSHSLQTSEDWKQKNTLPLPAQFLMMSSELSNQRGIGMRYRLLSLWPVNSANSPRSPTETQGLREVAKNPQTPFTWIVRKKGMWVYEAIYPDLAVAETCVNCHNNHPNSPKRDFKLGDVMGGIVIDLPLGKQFKEKPGDQFVFPPEVVADYVHSVLESDREIYTKHIVDRLESKHILSATESWEKDHALMLPAQFLMNSSNLIRRKGLGLDFQLISLWPINEKNRPDSDFEQLGLETVGYHPIRPYIGRIKVGSKKYFQSVYPDLALSKACVECHNAHPKSRKRDFKLNDVMGGVVITLPLK